MHRMLVLLFLLAIVAPAAAQVPSTYSVSGVVCTTSPYEWEAQAGCYEPVPAAQVHIQGDAIVAGVGALEKEATTDDGGWFSFDGLPEGEYTLTVTRTGFEPQVRKISVASHTDVEVAMTARPVQGSGQVFDPDGAPVAGAQVRGWGPDTYISTQTAADGRFSFETRAGWHSIQVRAPGLRPADLYRFVDGTGFQVNLEPMPPPDLFLTGRVVDGDDAPVADARVESFQYTQAFGEFQNWTTTRADGTYRLGAYVGDGSLSASKEGFTHQDRWIYVEQDAQYDFRILEVPEPTARLVGSVIDAVTGESVHNARISIQLPQFGLWECSRAGAGAEPMVVQDIAYPGPRYEEPVCRIEVDGAAFSGNVTPGYAVLEVWHDRWADCPSSSSSDGTMQSDCGPGYYSYSQTLRLKADAANPIEVRLHPRPGSDSVASGYVLDEATGESLAGARVSFWNQERDGWGEATTDEDGSYRIRLVSGYHRISVWAEGHMRWEGVVDVAAGGETPLDVRLAEGEASYGCCYEVAYAHAEDMGSAQASGPSPGIATSQGGAYEDLGGGLGPYDAQKRNAATSDAGNDTPAPFALAALAALAIALRRRR